MKRTCLKDEDELTRGPLCGFLRRQELRELRLLQKEEQRAQQQLSNKLQQQREQIFRRFEQETAVSQCSNRSAVFFLYLAYT